MSTNKPIHIKSFEEFTDSGLQEGSDDTMTKNRADGDGRETPHDKQDDTTEAIKYAKEQVSACVGILEELVKSMEEAKLTKKPIEESLSNLKLYLQSLEKAEDISAKSNTIQQ